MDTRLREWLIRYEVQDVYEESLSELIDSMKTQCESLREEIYAKKKKLAQDIILVRCNFPVNTGDARERWMNDMEEIDHLQTKLDQLEECLPKLDILKEQ